MAQAKLSERQRVSVLMMRDWGDRVRSYDQVPLLFNRTIRNGEELNPVAKSTIERTVRLFMNHGSIKDLQRTGRPKSAGSEQMQMDIAQAFVENPHLSLHRASDERDVAPEIVQNILKSINFHPYKVHLVQELNEDDPDRRVEFYEIMMDRIDRDPLFLYNTVFSDEATFTLKGEVNRLEFVSNNLHNQDQCRNLILLLFSFPLAYLFLIIHLHIFVFLVYLSFFLFEREYFLNL